MWCGAFSPYGNNLDGPFLQEKICNSMADLIIAIITVLWNQITQMRPFWKGEGWGNIKTKLIKNWTFVYSLQALVVRSPTIIGIAWPQDKTNPKYNRNNLCKKKNSNFFLHKLSRVYSGFVLFYGHAIPIIVGLRNTRVNI